MKMKLKGLKRSIASLGLVGVLSLGGCTGKFNPGSVTFQKNAQGREDASAFALYGLGTGLQAKSNQYAQQGDFQRANSAAGLGDLTKTGGQWTHDSNVAREGRVDVNVYNQPQQENNASANQFFHPIEVFACNYWKDFNGNGFMEKEEYVGIKSKFRVGEPITFAALDLKRGNLKFDLMNNREELIGSNESFVPRDSMADCQKVEIPLSPGFYVGSFYLNGNNLGNIQIEVTN